MGKSKRAGLVATVWQRAMSDYVWQVRDVDGSLVASGSTDSEAGAWANVSEYGAVDFHQYREDDPVADAARAKATADKYGYEEYTPEVAEAMANSRGMTRNS